MWKWVLRWLSMLSAGVGAGNNKPGENENLISTLWIKVV